jgi:hypothetical protein
MPKIKTIEPKAKVVGIVYTLEDGTLITWSKEFPQFRVTYPSSPTRNALTDLSPDLSSTYFFVEEFSKLY